MAIEVILNGDNKSAIKELHDLEIIASVERGNVNARITTEQLTFVNEYAELIRTYIAGGANGTTNGIFEGLPIQMLESGVNVFDGYLDQLNDFEIVDPTTVRARIKKHNSNNNFQDQANGLSFGYLEEVGFINANDYIDIPYVIEKEFNFVEFAFIAFAIYSVVRDLEEIFASVAYHAGIVGGDTAGGATGAAGAAITAAAIIAFNLAIAALLLIIAVNLTIDLINYCISPVKYHKGIRVETLLQKGCAWQGLTYNTSIPDIPKLVILPTKTGIDKDQQQTFIKLGITIYQPGSGIPSTSDFGYLFGELLSMLNDVFYAEYTIKNGVLQHHTIDTAWWFQNSSYVMPPVLNESIVTNANELASDKLIAFKADVKDSNTAENFLGTTYEIRTRPNTFSDGRNILMNGFEKIAIPYSLGNRKEGLNNFERLVIKLLEALDDLIIWSDGPGDSANKVKDRVGMLKLETDYLHIPKLMKMDSNNKLAVNDRTFWSAKYLYNSYHNLGSFVLNNYGNQYFLYKDVKVPFGFTEFNQLTENSYFSDSDGNKCKLEQIVWNVSEDFALINYRVKKKYTTNLQEIYIEQD